MFYWLMKYVVIGPVIKAVFRPWMVGRRNIPAEGAAILASNHLSFSDSFFLPLMCERRITFLAKSDYFTGRSLKGRAVAAFFRAINQIPMDRSGGRKSAASLSAGGAVRPSRDGRVRVSPGGRVLAREAPARASRAGTVPPSASVTNRPRSARPPGASM